MARVSALHGGRQCGRSSCAAPRRAVRVSAVAQPLPDSREGREGARCPFTGRLADEGAGGAPRQASGSVATPGPAAFSLQSLQDVALIFTDGLHEAMLRFAQRYGPVSRWESEGWGVGRVPHGMLHPTHARAHPPPSLRFANPSALHSATGWVFIMDPTDIAHVAAGNVRNYNERCGGVGAMRPSHPSTPSTNTLTRAHAATSPTFIRG